MPEFTILQLIVIQDRLRNYLHRYKIIKKKIKKNYNFFFIKYFSGMMVVYGGRSTVYFLIKKKYINILIQFLY